MKGENKSFSTPRVTVVDLGKHPFVQKYLCSSCSTDGPQGTISLIFMPLLSPLLYCLLAKWFPFVSRILASMGQAEAWRELAYWGLLVWTVFSYFLVLDALIFGVLILETLFLPSYLISRASKWLLCECITEVPTSQSWAYSSSPLLCLSHAKHIFPCPCFWGPGV